MQEVYYSMFANTYLMARAVENGIRSSEGEVVFRTVPELLPKESIEKNVRNLLKQNQSTDVLKELICVKIFIYSNTIKHFMFF